VASPSPALRLEVRASEYLPFIDDLTHDCFFAVSRIEHDPACGRLTIPFGRPIVPWRTLTWRSGAPGQVACTLIVYGVSSYVAEDTQGIDNYNFNETHYARETRVLRFETGIPMLLSATVTHLHIEVLLPRPPPPPEMDRDAATTERLPPWVRLGRAIRARLHGRP
jgi:hypothetical protein